jgi:SET domain-containing protein
MRRVIVRRSSVHGKGVFAVRSLAAGERVLEYKGEIPSWRNAGRPHQREGVEGHTFLFGLSQSARSITS